MPQDAITGLALANNATDATNDIDIAVGRALAGAGDYNLILTSARIKQLDATWVVGTNQGGLDTGAKAVSTWYHVWLIGRVDTHVVDVLFSTSATAPTMPTNYTKKRRIGAIRTDAAGAIIPFLQYGNNFFWKSPPALDVDDATLTTAKKNYTLTSVPSGFSLKVYANVAVFNAAIGGAYISNPNMTDLAPSTTATPGITVRNIVAGQIEFIKIDILTDTANAISARALAASTTLRVAVLGWEDPRGKW